ncbi:HEAT repeat domain-containing protein [Sphingobacterium spiritivorum]|uniref:HEAT repeat domain-containing protein n=1 Tax=Sphingobacterium spiritivorum TaxID=258 RepID=UPI003DA54A89
MIRLRKTLLSLTCLALVASSYGQEIIKPSVSSKTSFAIVVDQKTFNDLKPEVMAYRQSVEQDGLGTYIIAHSWEKPEQIREQLQQLRKTKQPLEGTVLIGNIPVVMIRDAQYLTSAFKMNQKIRWDKSSVPSDRYYDDLDLKLNFIKQDTASERSNYFYYSLDATSPQYIEMDIYSARIKPPVEKGENPTDKIKAYLQKLVELRKVSNPLNDMIASTGHGYNSNSINSFAGDVLALKSQFPSLYLPGNSIKFLNFRNADFMKFNLLRELKREGLDFAFMTGHGTPTLQLINGYPLASNPQPSMENVGRYLRAKVRSAKEDGRDVEKVKEGFKTSLGVSDKWMNDAFEKAVIDSDSVFNDNLDVQIWDIRDAGIQAPLVYLNSCLTGSFHLDNYLAGYYPFSNNKNIAAIANSVGVLQDLWPAELMGTLQHGIRIGNWFKHIAYLETHILGDPTFHFSSSRSKEINEAIGTVAKASYWKSLLKEQDADLQSLALVYLQKQLPEAEMSALLKSTYFSSPFETTRMQAFALLRKYENDAYFTVLHAARQDSYEFIRRMAVYDLGEFGGDDFAKDLIAFYVSDPHSERINYRLRTNMTFFNPELLKTEINNQVSQNKGINNASALSAQLIKDIDYNQSKVDKMQATILDKNTAEKERLAEITTLRLYRYHRVVPAVLKVIEDASESEALRITALEVMSWFPLSYQREAIFRTCDALLQDNKVPPAVKEQALKTKHVMKKESI